MSKIDDLIQEYCPDGVEFKKIKDVFTRIKGTPITAGKMKEIEQEDGDIRIFAGGRTVVNAYEKDIPKANIIKVPAVIVQSRGVIDFIYYDKPFTFKNEMWAYIGKSEIELKFLYYLLKNDIDYFKNASIGMGAFPQISLPVTEDYLIPCPPLNVQEEIVNILDKFTELQVELYAELQARIKQYEWYRNDLLSFKDKNATKTAIKLLFWLQNRRIEDFEKSLVVLEKFLEDCKNNRYDVELKKLIDCCNILDNRRKPITKSVREQGKYPYYGANGIQDYVSDYIFDGIFVLIGEDGSVINALGNPIVHWAKGKIWVNNHAHIIEEKNGVLLRYLFYYLQTLNVSDLVHGNIPKLTQNDLKSLNIFVPSIEVQNAIVNILDTFYNYSQDINGILPKEIEKRKLQYEYYRNKLLTFKEKL